MNRVELLKKMVSIPSLSRKEDDISIFISEVLRSEGCGVERYGNNIVARGECYSSDLPVVMLNSHLDTVSPSAGYSRDPFCPEVEEGVLYGLGSNDAGGSVVSLISIFLELRNVRLPFNLVLALSAEEECSGRGGMSMLLESIGRIDMGLVGEPTGMRAATGERGLVVLDCISKGVSGHVAHSTGVNAIYAALDDIAELRKFRFPSVSDSLGDISVHITQIEAGRQHNVIPDECKWVVDVRTTDAFTNEETVALISGVVKSEVKPRSTRLRASALSSDHPLFRAARLAGIETFLSPTMSDMALMPFPTIKMGPGDSRRSHTADEYIRLEELDEAMPVYRSFIKNLGNCF